MNTIEAFQETAYKDFGSIEGRFTLVAKKKDKYKIKIIHDLDGRSIECNIPQNMLPQVLENFDKRIYVWGFVHHRADGIPSKIDVEEFEVFPDPETLPELEEVRAIFRKLNEKITMQNGKKL